MFDGARLATIEEKLERLLRVLPPDDSPFRDNGLCHLRRPDTPCRCKGWLELLHGGRKDEQGSYYGPPPQIVKGCVIELLPWMISQNIVTNNAAAMDFTAAITKLDQVGTNLGMITGALSVFVPAFVAGSNSVLLNGKIPGVPLQIDGIDDTRDADAGTNHGGVVDAIADP